MGFARFLNLTSKKGGSINFFYLFLFSGLAIIVSTSNAVENPGDDPLQWLRDSIPGEPGVDYPIFSAVEQTAFSCDGKVFGGKIFYHYYYYILNACIA